MHYALLSELYHACSDLSANSYSIIAEGISVKQVLVFNLRFLYNYIYIYIYETDVTRSP